MTDRLDPDLDLDIDLDLGAAARAYDVPAGDVDAVLRRGRHRLSRRHRAVAGMSVVALVAATMASVNLLTDEGATTVSSGSAVVRGDVGVVWRTVSPDSGLGSASAPGAGSPLYALSTAPGQADLGGNAPPRVVWRSDDGVEWTAVSTLGPDLFLSDLSARDSRVYAVGTGPAAAAVAGRPVSPLLVGWSDDGARTWQRAQLPLDLEAIAARTTRSTVRGTAVAAGPRGTVVVGVLSASLDVHAALPAGVTAPNGWAATPTGIDVLGPDRELVCPEGSSPPEQDGTTPATAVVPGPDRIPTGEVHPAWCVGKDGSPVAVSPQDARGVTASYPWAQLGVDGDLLRAVRGQPVAFFAPPGGDRFQRVDLPDLEAVQGPVLLDVHDGGFDLVTTTTDGRLRGEPTGIVTILSSPDGRSWAASDAPPPGGQLWASAAGRVGGLVTIVAQRESGAVVVQADGGGGWTTTPLAGAVDADALDGGNVHLMSAGVGPFGVVAAVGVPSSEGGPVEPRVVVSRDGRTWGDVAVGDLAGRPVRNVIRAAVVGDRFTVSVAVIAADGDRPEQVVLVGTAG